MKPPRVACSELGDCPRHKESHGVCCVVMCWIIEGQRKMCTVTSQGCLPDMKRGLSECSAAVTQAIPLDPTSSHDVYSSVISPAVAPEGNESQCVCSVINHIVTMGMCVP